MTAAPRRGDRDVLLSRVDPHLGATFRRLCLTLGLSQSDAIEEAVAQWSARNAPRGAETASGDAAHYESEVDRLVKLANQGAAHRRSRRPTLPE